MKTIAQALAWVRFLSGTALKGRQKIVHPGCRDFLLPLQGRRGEKRLPGFSLGYGLMALQAD
jgi:hypothetical protein